MSDGKNRLPTEARSAEVEQFLEKTEEGAAGASRRRAGG